MKTFIWIACILGASTAQVLLKYAGIGGAIPAILIYYGMSVSAKALCKKYDRKKAQKAALYNYSAVSCNNVPKSPAPTAKPSHPPIAFCRKCGNKLIKGSAFCSSCGAAVIKE